MRSLFFNVRNFRTQIFLAFTLMLILIIIWFLFYLQTDRKIDALNTFTFKTNRVSKDFSTNVGNFKSFLLFGYKEKEFYTTKNQADLNLYIGNLKKEKKEISEILVESKDLKIDLNKSIYKLSRDLDSLYNNVLKFKQIALKRGFKDYGVEGKMREKAHLLENNPSFNKVTLLELRRHEKDYLLRAESQYYDKFSLLADQTLSQHSLNNTTRALLVGYKNDFGELAKLSLDLGFSQNQGLYGQINYLNVFIEDSFVQIATLSKKKATQLQNRLFNYQLLQTLILAILGLIICIYLSRYFTKDIEKLTLDISDYIKSNFKENSKSTVQKSQIGEVNYLLKSYGILKEKLAENIDFLEKATDKANRTAEFKSQFLANMSHEIRTPLNGVIGMLSLLKTKKMTAEQTDFIEVAEHSARHLLGIVNMILDHSKMEAGKIKLDEYPINLKRELDQLIRMFDYRIKDKNIKLHFTFDERIESNILGDNLRLQQILINLIDNAIKFTDIGEIVLEVKVSQRSPELQMLEFKVIDTGIGINVDEIGNLLKAFEQADLTTTRKYGGTGLGLTISNQLVKLMGGKRLNIATGETGGSVFSFKVPFKINDQVLPVQHPKIATGNPENGIKQALLAEDNLINQKVFTKLLEKLGIACDIANNGIEAVSLYAEKEYDIIFMDLHMPEMDGFEATLKIHASAKYQLQPTPIIAVTASVLDEDKEKALSKGMNDFITKPVILKDLEETIAKQIKKP